MATLKEYLNAKIKSKGSSFSKEKARAKDYKSISAAKKAGALYYTNKAGKVMAAVFAEDLKASPAKPKPKGATRPKARPKTLVKSSAPAKSGRPKASTLRAKPKASSTGSRKTVLTKGQKPKILATLNKKTANERAVDAEIAANNKKIAANDKKLAANRKKIVDNSSANKSRKTRVTKGEKPKFPFTIKLTGAAWMKKHTFADYMNLTKAEAKALGLPQTRLAAVGTKFMDASKYKFKDGKGFINISK
tara:strand:+ start:54 stop:797 length:744 start_codon:yes stop_codon:yes gene_type:complete